MDDYWAIHQDRLLCTSLVALGFLDPRHSVISLPTLAILFFSLRFVGLVDRLSC